MTGIGQGMQFFVINKVIARTDIGLIFALNNTTGYSS
jgi:hypothetical protein